jgi:uncharacterized RDD family membrane protein YckC
MLMEERIGFGKRLAAALIDFVVIVVAGLIVGAVLGGVLGAGAGAAGGAEAEAVALGGVFGALAGAALGIQLLSLGWIVWEGLTGAALGKRLLKIRIKSEDGSPGKVGTLIARAAIKYVATLLGLVATLTGLAFIDKVGNLGGLLIFIGCFFVLGQKRQAFHDMIAKTAVYRD